MKVPHTLEEANRLKLDVTFLPTATEAEAHALVLTAHGRSVVAVFAELLPGASKELHLVCVAPQKHAVGPLGLDRKANI